MVRDDPQEQFPFPGRPGLDARLRGRRALGRGIHVMGRTLEQHAPALAPGIISRADVLSVFDRTDEAIRKEITDEVLRRDLVVDPRTFDVTVSDGVVTLAGVPDTSEFGHEIVRRVRHVQGVVAVRDRFSYPAPGHRADRFDVLVNFPMD